MNIKKRNNLRLFLSVSMALVIILVSSFFVINNNIFDKRTTDNFVDDNISDDDIYISEKNTEQRICDEESLLKDNDEQMDIVICDSSFSIVGDLNTNNNFQKYFESYSPQYYGDDDDYGKPIDNNVNRLAWTNHTADDAISWCWAQNGCYLDHDGAYGAQCVDLTMYYYDYLGPGAVGGNACDYTWNYLPEGWQRYQGGQPQKGDILVYLNGSYGHVAIYENDYSIFHQNYCGHQYVEHSTFRFDDAGWIGSNYWGCIHPDFQGGGGGGWGPEINIESGVYTLKSCVGNKFLDIAQNSYQPGANAHIWQSIDYDAQHFYIYWNPYAGDYGQGGYHIEHGHSGQFLDTEGNSSAMGANVFQWGDTGANGQYWRFEDAGDGYVYIRSLLGMYLDVNNGICQDGQNVQSWEGNGTPAQKWRLCKISEAPKIDISAGMYNLRSAVGDKNLDVYGGGYESGVNFNIYSVNDTDAQNFNIYWNSVAGDHAQGGYHIEHMHSGMFADTNGDDVPPGSNVHQWGDSGSNGQYWIFEDAGDGWVYIRNLWGYYLDVCNGADMDQANVQIWNWNGSSAQKWKLIPRSDKPKVEIADGNYYVHSDVGHKVLEIKNDSRELGANLQINAMEEDDAQQINIVYNPKGGNFSQGGNHLEHCHSGLYLDTENNNRNPGANVFQWDDTGANGQYWRFEDAGDGYVYIYNLWGNYLTVDGGWDIPGRNVIVSSFIGDESQKFRFEPTIGYQQFLIPDGRTLKYNGDIQIGVPEGFGYTISNNTATEPGKYYAVATLINPYITNWIDGTNSTKTIEWEIVM